MKTILILFFWSVLPAAIVIPVYQMTIGSKLSENINQAKKINRNLFDIDNRLVALSVEEVNYSNREEQLIDDLIQDIEDDLIDTTGEVGIGNALILYSNKFGDLIDATNFENELESNFKEEIQVKSVKKKN